MDAPERHARLLDEGLGELRRDAAVARLERLEPALDAMEARRGALPRQTREPACLEPWHRWTAREKLAEETSRGKMKRI